jgi:hypothetical protein
MRALTKNDAIGLLFLSLLSCHIHRVLVTIELPLLEQQACCGCTVCRTFKRAPMSKELQRFDAVGSFSGKLTGG